MRRRFFIIWSHYYSLIYSFFAPYSPLRSDFSFSRSRASKCVLSLLCLCLSWGPFYYSAKSAFSLFARATSQCVCSSGSSVALTCTLATKGTIPIPSAFFKTRKKRPFKQKFPHPKKRPVYSHRFSPPTRVIRVQANIREKKHSTQRLAVLLGESLAVPVIFFNHLKASNQSRIPATPLALSTTGHPLSLSPQRKQEHDTPTHRSSVIFSFQPLPLPPRTIDIRFQASIRTCHSSWTYSNSANW